jgi:hypothetical protein
VWTHLPGIRTHSALFPGSDLTPLVALEETGRLRTDARLAFRMVYMHRFNFMIVELLFGGNDHYGTPLPAAVDLIVDVFSGGLMVNRPEPGKSARLVPRPGPRGSSS